jgi:hypothetical protein
LAKKGKPRKKCCGKYLKSGKHCKGCPLLLIGAGTAAKEKKTSTKKDKEKKVGKKK